MNLDIPTGPGTFVAITVGLIVLRWAAELVLARLNTSEVRHNADRIPSQFADIMDEATYRRSVEYTLARLRFGTLKDSWDAILVLAILFSGVLPSAFDTGTKWLGTGVWGSASTLFSIALFISLLGTPWDLYEQFNLEERFGFNTTTARTWIADRLKGLLVSTILVVPLLAFLLKMVSVAGEHWWVWAWLGVLGFQFLIMLLAPAVILPLFNRFTPLPDGALKERLWNLAKRTGFSAQSIQVMDGSRRSKHSNAFFTGLGRHRKIVLYDTLTEQLDTDELEAVLAHEIGHFKLRHIPKLLITSALGILLFFYLLQLLMSQARFYEAFGFAPESPAPALLIFFLLAGTLSFWVTPILNRLSRKHEFEADAFAVKAVSSARPLCSSLRRLSAKNLSNLTPHPLYSAFYYSHPTLIERERAMQSASTTD